MTRGMTGGVSREMSSPARIAPGSDADGSADTLDNVTTGPEVAAFFDFDGTVIDGFSAVVFQWDRIRHLRMSPAELGRLLLLVPPLVIGRADTADIITSALAGLQGHSEEELAEQGERLFADQLARLVYPEARARIAAHQARGHTIVLASSAVHFQVDAFARDLGIEHVLCTAIESTPDGVLTSQVVGPLLREAAKATAVRAFAERRGIDLNASFAYANGEEDIPFLQAVGHPYAINPGSGLAAAAAKEGWPVQRYASRRGFDLGRTVRTGAGYGSMLLAGGVGAAVGLLNRSRRQGINTMTSVAPDLALALTGVTLRVQGEEHLWLSRPAVFIANHQSPADVLVLAGLLRRDFTGVAKKELGRHPVLGPLGRLAQVVFIDRTDSERAIADLGGAVDKLRDGVSIIVLPEGTRSPTPQPGPFKKGAFHIALQAGVPIVPIVICNSGDVMWRNARTIRPGTVDVVVHPPISTDHWQVATLDERVRQIRQLYLDTLRTVPAFPQVPEGHGTAAGRSGW